MAYPNLYEQFNWPLGVHKAPAGYQHPWLVVTDQETAGYYSRFAARVAWRQAQQGIPVESQ